MDWTRDLLSKASSYLEKVPKYLIYALAAYGALRTLRGILSPLAAFYRYRFRGIENLLSKYGIDSYVLVTGASDGVGKALVYQFARLGFNLVLVARRENLLQAIKTDLEQKYKVKVVVVPYDLAKGANYSQLTTGLLARVQNLDISILVNNAGMGYRSAFARAPVEAIEDIINLNAVVPTLLMNIMLPRLAARKNRSGVINISSGLGQTPVGGSAAYSATKAYLRFLTYAVGEEVKAKVDLLTVNLGRTRTAIIHYQKDFFTVEPEEAAFGIIRDLGKYRETDATFRQYLGYYLLGFLPFGRRVEMLTKNNSKFFREKEGSVGHEK